MGKEKPCIEGREAQALPSAYPGVASDAKGAFTLVTVVDPGRW